MTDIGITEAGSSDKEEIARFLSADDSSLPFHRMEWLEAIKKAYGHDYVYFVARRGETIVGVLPTCSFKRFSGKYICCSVPFCDVGGTVAESEEVKTALVKRALERLDFNKSQFLEIRQRSIHTEIDEDLTNRKVSMLLDLPESAEILMKGFKSKLRSQIKKARSNGLTFDYANDAQCIEDFFGVHCSNMRALGSPIHSRRWFHSLRQAFQEQLLVGRIWYQGECIAAGVLMFGSRNVSIPWASTLREHNRLAPNMLLYWNLLKISCDRGYENFDFGRSTFGEGTYRFKKQWGAKAVPLQWSRFDKSGQCAGVSGSQSSAMRTVTTSIWKNLPLHITNTVGPRVRKYISL